MRVYIYWNLHKHLFSVKDTRSGIVVAHSIQAVIKDATFAVSQAGRARVLRERRKNVHAGVRGELVFEQTKGRGVEPFTKLERYNLDMRGWTRITYNPYKYDSFVTAKGEHPVAGADEVRLVIRDGRARIYAKGVHYKEVALAA